MSVNKIQLLTSKNQELESQNVIKDKTIAECKSVIEKLEHRLSQHSSEINNQVSVNTRLAKAELELKTRLESAKAKNFSQEEILRKVSEENYSLKSEIKNLQTDLQNIVIVEDSLRKELERTSVKSKELEDFISKMKSKI